MAASLILHCNSSLKIIIADQHRCTTRQQASLVVGQRVAFCPLDFGCSGTVSHHRASSARMNVVAEVASHVLGYSSRASAIVRHVVDQSPVLQSELVAISNFGQDGEKYRMFFGHVVSNSPLMTAHFPPTSEHIWSPANKS